MKVFILQSGRSGSLFLTNLLKKNGFENVYHEYNLMRYKPELVTYQITKKNNKKKEFLKIFEKNYLSKIKKKKEFVDISYGITNINCITEIKKKFPESKFIFVIRNGKKVVNSWINKLGKEIYEPKSMEKLKQFVLGNKIKLSRNKKYWWHIKVDKYKKFNNVDQFKHVCNHWNDVCKLSKKIKKKYKDDVLIIKFEEFIKQKKIRQKFFDFLGLKNFKFIRKKINIVNKEKYLLTINQTQIFKRKCSLTMQKLGYKV